jgi:hypothetical protein
MEFFHKVENGINQERKDDGIESKGEHALQECELPHPV